jgi:hypothetical protein
MFISPRYLEFFSRQAPKGEEGLYLGFGLSGFLLTAYCPDPKTLAPARVAVSYAHTHYIWYHFAAIGTASAIALFIYARITKRLDAKKAPPK